VHDLGGRTAVVTGAASGIGRSLARRFAAEGMRVVIADVEDAALRETATLVRADIVDAQVIAHVTDVTRLTAVEELADRAYEAFGAVDVLCNNAGVFQGGLLWECVDADFEWTLAVNLFGILHGVRAFVPRMLAADADAHIVNTVSMAGLATTPYSGPYDVSKFAAMAATECLAHDLAAIGSRIRVSALCPSLVATAIGSSGRNRPATLASETTAAAAFVEQALTDSTAGGLHPDAVAGMVVDAIRDEQFLVPTRESYARQLTDRADDLVARRAPRSPAFD
jgi:NAD(P)-dependent dehydrogenase (short-subunit alcohol dehydrogenase family)